jgi:hypothetical protein
MPMKKVLLWVLSTIAFLDLAVRVAYADVVGVSELAGLGAVACLGIGILVLVIALASFLVLRAIKKRQTQANGIQDDDLEPGG